MKIEVLNVSKFRQSARVGDDVPFVLPGLVYGICDGATDPRGTIVDGIGAGRLAALTVSASAMQMALDPAAGSLTGDEILRRLSEALAARTAPLDLPIPPSTTLAMALDCGDQWRFISLGDTGFRLNGAEVLRWEKLIDSISTHARVAAFRVLAGDAPATDATEAAARRVILLGFDIAVDEGVLTRQAAKEIIEATIADLGLDACRAAVVEFLRGGIKTQYLHTNDPDSPLGFDSLNGVMPRRGDHIDVIRPKAEVRSIEIFTDGYPAIPDAVSIDAWEAAFARAEAEDVHKIGAYATVKGSTEAEFFDDRTVIVVDRL